MDKQKELNAYEQMAIVCARWFSCGTCPYNPEANKESICPNFDKKLVYAMGKGYRKIPEGVVLTREEYSDYLVMKGAHQNVIERCEKLQVDNERLYKNIGKFKDAVRKETAEKFAKRLKARYMPPLAEWDEISIGGLFYEIDEICKELVDEK
jgi:hypothetical protein